MDALAGYGSSSDESEEEKPHKGTKTNESASNRDQEAPEPTKSQLQDVLLPTCHSTPLLQARQESYVQEMTKKGATTASLGSISLQATRLNELPPSVDPLASRWTPLQA